MFSDFGESVTCHKLFKSSTHPSFGKHEVVFLIRIKNWHTVSVDLAQFFFHYWRAKENWLPHLVSFGTIGKLGRAKITATTIRSNPLSLLGAVHNEEMCTRIVPDLGELHYLSVGPERRILMQCDPKGNEVKRIHHIN